MTEKTINVIGQNVLKRMKKIKEEIKINSLYYLESSRDPLEEEQMVKSLLGYISATYVDFGDDIEIETIKFERYYNISFRGEHQDLVQNANVTLTYMETTKYAKVDDLFPTVQITPVITIRTQKKKFCYKNGECKSINCYDLVEIRPDGIYGRVSNTDDNKNVITTLFRGDVVIPNDKKTEVRWLSDFEFTDILWLGIGLNKEQVMESNNIVQMEEQRRTMRPNC